MIRVDYDSSLASAGKLAGAADQCEHNIRQAKNMLSAIPGCWEGESARAFAAELNQWIAENQTLKNELDALARDIRSTVREFKAAEARIKAAAAARIEEAAAQAAQADSTSPQPHQGQGRREYAELDERLKNAAENVGDIFKNLEKFF